MTNFSAVMEMSKSKVIQKGRPLTPEELWRLSEFFKMMSEEMEAQGLTERDIIKMAREIWKEPMRRRRQEREAQKMGDTKRSRKKKG